MLYVSEVPLEYTVIIWPHVEHFIEQSLQHSCGELTAADARVYVTQGHWVLLSVYNEDNNVVGALVVQFFNRVRDRVAFIVAMGGKTILSPETFDQFASILMRNGATCVEGGVRKSVARLLHRYGFTHKYSIVGRSL